MKYACMINNLKITHTCINIMYTGNGSGNVALTTKLEVQLNVCMKVYLVVLCIQKFVLCKDLAVELWSFQHSPNKQKCQVYVILCAESAICLFCILP